MDTFDYLQGSISEINAQVVQLMERKKQLLQLIEKERAGGRPEEASDSAASPEEKAEDFLAGSSYAKYLDMMKSCRQPVERPHVVYQGEPGAYSEAAARNFFGKDVDSEGLYSFDDTFLALAEGRADYAVLPIENSSTGAIRQVYDLLEQYHFFFVGETTVEINHAFMIMPEADISDITTVYSHEQGLFQCEKFLSQHPEWKTVAQMDTAGSARIVAEQGDIHKAAICSELAAEIYGLKVIKSRVNTQSANTTRFIIVSPKPEMRENRDKICISLTTANNSGALHNVLTVFAVHGVNLVRLESRPIPERNWEYMFFIEFTGDLLTKAIDPVIHEISLLAKDLRVMGNFQANLND